MSTSARSTWAGAPPRRRTCGEGTVPQFALDHEIKEAPSSTAPHRALWCEALGPRRQAPRTWVLIDDVTDGNWGGAGRVYQLPRPFTALVNGRLAPAPERYSARSATAAGCASRGAPPGR
jgi:hypothetical protein